MKLRNRKTGEIIEFDAILPVKDVAGDSVAHLEYGSLAELNAEWCDYEEPKDIWWLDNEGNINHSTSEFDDHFEKNREIGNYFSSREEAELAVRKLKAWKRLKDKGFRFNLNYSTGGATINHKDVIMCRIEAYFDDKWEEENMKAEEDLDLLLGGEE